MTKQDFFTNLKEELELEVALNGAINFKELDEWDSMTAMVLIGYVSSEFDDAFFRVTNHLKNLCYDN